MNRSILYIFLLVVIVGCSNQHKRSTDWSKLNLNGKVKSLQTTTYKAINKFGKLYMGAKISEISGQDKHIEFNRDGYIIAQTVFKKNGSILFKSSLFYDSTKNITRVADYDSVGNLEDEDKRIYNKTGKLIKVNDYNAKGMLSSYQVYKYEGNSTREIDYNKNKQITSEIVYKYDKRHLLIEIDRYNSDGSLSFKFKLKYDNDDNVIQDITGSDTTAYKYTFDKKGNWVQKIEFEGDNATYITQRKLIYF